ncbi:hypothetical protein SAMN02744775_00324 [Enterobacter sp. CC120223-11]|nr:hypothetical protein SAMN02744775_00324 [Enterobacter sp. CC120223-11]
MFSKSKHGDATKIEIINTGTFKSYKIPSVIVFCEDKVAEELIINALSHKEKNVGSFKFRRCGSWTNIIISLAGCILYSQELIKSGNSKVLEVVGVIDGDINDNDISQVISGTFEGEFIPEQLQEITRLISNHIISFKIPTAVLSKKNIKGKPELNLKNMVDEITSDMVREPSKKRVNDLCGFLEKTKDDELKRNIEFELNDIYKEQEETLKIIKISNDIIFHENDGIINYHSYFKKLQKKIGDVFYRSYSFTHQPIYLVYRIVSKYNKNRWEEYINPVIDFLVSAQKRQTQSFSHHTFNNTKID